MPTRTLVELIQASGGAGTAGQSFRVNVTAAANDVKMTDYNITGWNILGAPSNGENHPSGSLFNSSGTVYFNPKASNISRLGAGKIEVIDWVGAQGFRVSGLSTNLNADGTFTASYAVDGPTTSEGSLGTSTWFNGYSQPTLPTYTGQTSDPVTMQGIANPGPSGNGIYSNLSIAFRYIPNDYYNPQLLEIFPLTIEHRAGGGDTGAYEWEFHNNASFTSLYSAGSAVGFNSSPGSRFPATANTYLYLRARHLTIPGAQWQTVANELFWNDPREQY